MERGREEGGCEERQRRRGMRVWREVERKEGVERGREEGGCGERQRGRRGRRVW